MLYFYYIRGAAGVSVGFWNYPKKMCPGFPGLI